MAGQRLAHLVTLMLIAAVGVVLFRPVPALAQSQELIALEKQVFSLYAAGKYAEAIPLANGLLRGYEAQLGKTHIGTANVMNTLAILYKARGAYAEAEQLTMSRRVISSAPSEPSSAAAVRENAGRYRAGIATTGRQPLRPRYLEPGRPAPSLRLTKGQGAGLARPPLEARLLGRKRI